MPQPRNFENWAGELFYATGLVRQFPCSMLVRRLRGMADFFWIAIIVASAALEVHSGALVALFVGAGALVALLLALVGVPFVLQAGAWLAFSGLSLGLLRPFAVKKFHHRARQLDLARPAMNAMTNLTGVVEITVGDELHPGRVKIQGESWKAVTDWPESLPGGSPVIVRKTFGTTLWVDPS